MTKYAKAIFAGVYAFLAALVVVLVGDTTFADITDGQWVAAVLAGLGAAGGVARVPNAGG